MNESGPNGDTATKPKERVSFSEVVRVHFRWAERFHDGKEGVATAKDELDTARQKFELHEGKIVDAYWCTTEASAVALTEKVPDPPQPRQLLRRREKPREPVLQLHRVTDWIMVDYLPVAELLHHCDTLAIKVECVLEGTARRVAMRWLLAVEENLLGFVERSRLAAQRGDEVRRSEVDRFVVKQRREILQIEDYYDRAGQKRARQVYVTGMLLGVLFLLPLAVGTAGLLSVFHMLDLHASGVRTFFACIAAGALGAIVSVLSRMAGRRGGFIVDHEIGRGGIRRLGSYRPVIGAVLGVALYFLARTTLLHLDPNVKTFSFFTIIAFLAGFSERWAQVVLGGAEQTVRASIGGKSS